MAGPGSAAAAAPRLPWQRRRIAALRLRAPRPLAFLNPLRARWRLVSPGLALIGRANRSPPLADWAGAGGGGGLCALIGRRAQRAGRGRRRRRGGRDAAGAAVPELEPESPASPAPLLTHGRCPAELGAAALGPRAGEREKSTGQSCGPARTPLGPARISGTRWHRRARAAPAPAGTPRPSASAALRANSWGGGCAGGVLLRACQVEILGL